ncbi:hypothetical protein NBRC116592_22090 [Colwellia sp. KU-HH00111]|uniref:hypothetical protein n=1 Tax=Colwellia sp. KU-HH00111 TaxID=3127652 RepID=UPI003104C68D
MKNLLIATLFMLVSINANATLITTVFDHDTFNIGDTVSAYIQVQDIEADALGFQKLISGFGISLAYDESLLAISSFGFGDKLNVDPFGPSTQNFNDAVLGQLVMSELSFAWFDDLFAAQSAFEEFNLITINFVALTQGDANFNILSAALADDFGSSFSNLQVLDSSVSIVGATQVPEPSSMGLMLLALLLVTRLPTKVAKR